MLLASDRLGGRGWLGDRAGGTYDLFWSDILVIVQQVNANTFVVFLCLAKNPSYFLACHTR